MATETEDPSYIDYETFLDPEFSPSSFANTLVLSTNNATDTPLDLSTPLSRILFDVQEINTHIDTLTTKSALPLLTHVQTSAQSSEKILKEVDAQVATLTDSYARLEKEVLKRYEEAEEVRVTAERLWRTVRLGRSVGRYLQMGRQLEGQMGEMNVGQGKKEDHRAMLRASNTLLLLRGLAQASGPDEEGEGLNKVDVINTLQNQIIAPAERTVRNKAAQIIREFSMSTLSTSTGATATTTTYAQTEDTKARCTSALQTLYLLSPLNPGTGTGLSKNKEFEPQFLIGAVEDYLKTAITSSTASLARALASLPTLDRTLLEVSARCQNIIALSTLLLTTKLPDHPLLPPQPLTTPPKSHHHQHYQNLLELILKHLETNSLPSFFWRSLAGNLSPKVSDILNKGGVQARTLRSQKERVREGVRNCVVRGSQPPAGVVEKGRGEGGWEREIAVMVSAVVGRIG